ncbi:hypothetical protein EON63_04665, partial [archaeon]
MAGGVIHFPIGKLHNPGCGWSLNATQDVNTNNKHKTPIIIVFIQAIESSEQQPPHHDDDDGSLGYSCHAQDSAERKRNGRAQQPVQKISSDQFAVDT